MVSFFVILCHFLVCNKYFGLLNDASHSTVSTVLWSGNRFLPVENDKCARLQRHLATCKTNQNQ